MSTAKKKQRSYTTEFREAAVRMVTVEKRTRPVLRSMVTSGSSARRAPVAPSC